MKRLPKVISFPHQYSLVSYKRKKNNKNKFNKYTQIHISNFEIELLCNWGQGRSGIFFIVFFSEMSKKTKETIQRFEILIKNRK